jgi:TatD DNase family protein
LLVDSHCHLDILARDADPAEILRRAAQADIQMIVNPAVDITSSQEILRLAEQFPQVKAAVGVHPNDILTQEVTEIIPELTRLAVLPGVSAIGEIGLDYYHQTTAKELQHQIFADQLALACETQLPVIIHSREALKDVIQTLQRYYPKQEHHELYRPRGVFHSFEGNLEDAWEVIHTGFFIGLGGPVTYKNAAVKQSLARELPLETILLETDSPFLTPVPHRGQANEPAYLKYVAEKVAILRECDIKQVEIITTFNARRLFLIGDALVRE